MDTHAARRARRKAFKADLSQAYTDEEATPPEWIDIGTHVASESASIRETVDDEARRFSTEPDIKRALSRRDRTAQELRRRIAEINRAIARLNLIAPHQRFTRSPLNADAILQPLYRTPRRST